MKLSYSKTMCFKTCRKKFELSYIRNLEPIEAPLPFTFGSAFHEALAEWYGKGLPGDRFEGAYTAIKRIFEDNKPGKLEDLPEWENQLNLTNRVFDRYRKQYKDDNFQFLEIEKEFNVPIRNPETDCKSRNFEFKGFADGLVKINDVYWLMEHKTASQINNQYKAKLTIDNQSIAYIEALQRVYDIKIKGVIYNVILKDVPNPPKVLKSGKLSTAKNQKTTHELYLRAIQERGEGSEDYTDILEELKRNRKEYFYREYITFTENDLEEWRVELWDLQKNIQEAIRKEQFYKNTGQCTGFGTCRFFDICTAIDKEQVIDLNYKQKEGK